MNLSRSSFTPYRRSAAALLLMAGVLGGLVSCVTLEESVPAVEDMHPHGPVTAGPTSALLSHGREIYITRCAKCHRAYPVRNYHEGEWAEIMPKMVAKTRLASADAEAVRSYVAAVLRG